MKWKIFFCILCIVLLSGCLDLVSTRQKQLCVSATHYSQTSIYECSKTSECFKKVNASGFYVSDNLNYNIKNQILIYKNNISSAIFYFNNAKTNIEKINEFCSGEKDVDIIKNINTLFFNLSNTFSYQDKSWQKSIEILKDYAIFLKENGVENISEEKIYDSYVLINQNLNELRGENQESENYVSLLKIEAKNAQELAKSFGFTQSYMTEYGFIDLFAYYSEYVDDPKKEIKLPIISKSSNYVFSKLSTMENFLRINQSLSRADNYNLYILFDKEFGTTDSLFTKFIKLSNQINQDLDLAYKTINEYEEFIENNIEELDNLNKNEYEKNKYKFNKQELGFGYYLEKLKEISLSLEENLELEENKQTEIAECETIITESKKYKNQYFQEIVENYQNSTDKDEKLNYCKILKNALSFKECFFELEELLELSFLDIPTNITSETECIEVLNQINYELEKDERILFFKKIIKDNYNLIKELEKIELTISQEIELLDYKYENQALDLENYKIIKDIEKNLEKANTLNKKINNLFNEIIEKKLLESEIYFENGNYYFVIYNNSTKNGEFCFSPDIDLKDLSPLDSRFKINKDKVCVELTTGENRYLIEYKNQKTTNTKLLFIDEENGLFETTVKNTCIGVFDSLNLGQLMLVDFVKYTIDSNNYIWYKTEKENKILYYKKILEKTNLGTTFLKTENENHLVTKFNLKNKTLEDFCTKVHLEKDCYDCIFLVKENGVSKVAYLDGSKITSELCFGIYEEKLIELQKIINFSKIGEEIDELNYKLNLLLYSEFEEINKIAKTKITELDKIKNKTLAVEDVIKFYKLKEEVLDLEKQHNELEYRINSFEIIISKLLLLELNQNELKELENIEKTKYKDSKKALDSITELYKTVIKRLENEDNIYSINFKTKINTLLDDAKTAGVLDDLTLNKINNFSITDKNTNSYDALEKEIFGKIENKATEIYAFLQTIRAIDIKEITALINETDYLFSEITLKKLYEIKYYPAITLQDAERLNKKKEYLQTITLTQNINKFENYYQDKEFLKAIKLMTPDIIERLQEITKETDLLKKGLIQIEKDATAEIEELKKIKKSKTLYPQIFENFENKKYLLVIKDIRSLKEPEKETKKLNLQIFVLFILLAIGGLSYKNLNKKQKKITKEEKKQKILRQY